jgi:glucose/arabinose dehydrogenase/mono/diheme cytochrome c family protein
LFSSFLQLRIQAATAAQNAAKEVIASPWGDWAEADFPFFSSVLDARRVGAISSENNLTPRALVLNLGHGVWAGFDADLLRFAAVWDGRGVTPVSGAQRSYHTPFRTPKGGGEFPVPDGPVWLANGIYPGWQTGEQFSSDDPREPQPSPEEVGRGPLPITRGKFGGLRLTPEGLRLEYSVAGTAIHEWVRAAVKDGKRTLERRLRIFPAHSFCLLVVAGIVPDGKNPLYVTLSGEAAQKYTVLKSEFAAWTVRVAPHESVIEFTVAISPDAAPESLGPWEHAAEDKGVAPLRWRGEVVTRGVVSAGKDAFVVDAIPLPVGNPWRRKVRLGDVQFFPDGRAAAVTVDGDVWLIDGLDGGLETVRWRRFASGLHEPISLAIRQGQIFVFDRNGVWRLQDANGDGEADNYEMFSNGFTQTADPSDLPNSIRLAPDGTFVIAKGGQRRKTYSRDSGTVLRISADGGSATMLGHGFRQPFVGVHPRTGMVTASDQDGHNVPATPLYIVEGNRDHGYPRLKTIPEILAKAHLPTVYSPNMAEPVVWMPRSVNSSGISQVWLVDARMGPLNDALVHIGYNRPELLVVRLDDRTPRRQAAAYSLTKDLRFPPLHGAVNPRDGQLYVAGFELNNSAKVSHGLARVRYTGTPYLMPRAVVAMDKGLLLRFDVPLDKGQATNRDNYSVARWNYKRTPNYASPPYKTDGSMGREVMTPSSAYLSSDGKSVFVGIPDMRPGMMQMQVNWTIAARDNAPARGEAVISPIALARFVSQEDGFSDLQVDLTPAPPRPPVEELVSATAGARLARSIGCYACHSTDGSKGIGPTWKGLAGSLRTLKGGEEVLADESYLRESILFPSAKIVDGFEEGMPGFAGIMGDAQIASLIQYIQSLQFK